MRVDRGSDAILIAFWQKSNSMMDQPTGGQADGRVDRPLMTLSTRVDWDLQGESGHGSLAKRDEETKGCSRLETGVPIHLVSPDPFRLMVVCFWAGQGH